MRRGRCEGDDVKGVILNYYSVCWRLVLSVCLSVCLWFDVLYLYCYLVVHMCS